MKKQIKNAVKSSKVGRSTVWPVARAVRRFRFARSYYGDSLRHIWAWAPRWTEDTNYYYDLTWRNREQLVAMVSAVCGTSNRRVDEYAREIESDEQLREHLEQLLWADPTLRDVQVAYGRRLGWYLFVRCLKPRVVVETGVSHGVGACVLASALLRNRAEGFPGKYIGTDIDPVAGELFTGPYQEAGEILVGDSLESLAGLTDEIDVFINDSDHSASYERSEYELVASRLSSGSLILGDNSHVTSELNEFAVAHGRPFLFFHEEPRDHWYPGGGIGISPSRLPLLDVPDSSHAN